jgi:hypothetical protein
MAPGEDSRSRPRATGHPVPAKPTPYELVYLAGHAPRSHPPLRRQGSQLVRRFNEARHQPADGRKCEDPPDRALRGNSSASSVAIPDAGDICLSLDPPIIVDESAS